MLTSWSAEWIRSQDSTCSLLAYVVKQYVKLSHMEETSPEATPSNVKATMPLPEPSDIVQASTVNFDDIELELKKIEQAVRGEWGMCGFIHSPPRPQDASRKWLKCFRSPQQKVSPCFRAAWRSSCCVVCVRAMCCDVICVIHLQRVPSLKFRRIIWWKQKKGLFLVHFCNFSSFFF